MKASLKLQDFHGRLQTAITKLLANVTVELKQDESSQDPAYILVGGFIYVMESEVEHRGIGGERKIPVWNVSYGYTDPGVRYHRDGSGTPPSFEMAEIGDFQSFWQVVSAVAQFILKHYIDQLGEQEMAEHMAKDLEDDRGMGDILTKLGIP